MGTLTLTNMQDEIRDNLGGRTDLDSRLPRFLNLAQKQITRIRGWQELEKLESKLATYTGTKATDRFLAFSTLTNTNPRVVYSVVVLDTTSSKKIIKLTPKQADKRFPARDQFTTARPVFYAKWEDKFEWIPVPDQAYTFEIRMRIWPTDLSSGSDTSDLDEKDDILISLATSLAFGSLGMHVDAAVHMKNYKQWKDDAILVDATDPDANIGASPAEDEGSITGDYWIDPFVRTSP